MTDPIFAFADHVCDMAFDSIPQEAVDAAKTFILDTVGVGIGGSTGPMAGELVGALSGVGAGQAARVWGTGERLPAPSAAMCNAYRTHCTEFDCVHEAAVAHVLTVVLPTALAESERTGGVNGRRLIEAVVLGVDVAVSLGISAKTGLRFFRPATVGAFGGVAALGKLHGLDRNELVNAFSLAYGQLSGTMQAHEEGSLLLAMQMGFNARNAVTAVDLSRAGFTGPKEILYGRFGYLRLFEPDGDATDAVGQLGKTWRITEIAHKPYPSGRATHGVLDACLALRREHAIASDQIAAVKARVPPLVAQLVGRPAMPEMAINYARLSARYVMACALIDGDVTVGDFSDAAYLRPGHQDLAARIDVVPVHELDANALTPVEVEIELADGRRHKQTVETVYGSPQNPMTRAAQLEKLKRNCAGAARPLPAAQVAELIACIDNLETCADVTRLVDLTVVP